jgi:hypothetical protein
MHRLADSAKVNKCTKTCQFNLSVNDDKYDTCEIASIKISGQEILPYGLYGFTADLLMSVYYASQVVRNC